MKRNILLTALATIGVVSANEIGKCQKNCGIEMGKCMIETFDMKECLKKEGVCALECFKSVKVQASLSEVQVKNMGQCQKNCGIDFGKCLITKFDMPQCLKEEAGCALECLKSVEKVEAPREIEVEGMGECQKECGIQYGICLLSKSFKECTKEEGICAASCLFKKEQVQSPPAQAVDVKSFSSC
jgi:hypothetical protein